MELRKSRSTRGRARDHEEEDGESMFESVSGNPSSKRDFSLVRPVCVQVMSCPTVSNLEQLSIRLHEVSAVIEPCLLDYIVYPLSHHLKLFRKYRYNHLSLLSCIYLVSRSLYVYKLQHNAMIIDNLASSRLGRE